MFIPKLNAAGTAYSPQPWDVSKVAGAPSRFPSANSANSIAATSIPAVAGMTAVVTGIEVWGGGATVALLVDVTLAGLASGAQAFPFATPAGALLAAAPMILNFDTPLLASAPNTAITLTLPALGVGNTRAAVVLKGYYV